MALGHCRHRIHSLGWSIVMFFLIYWACIDEPWVSLVTRVQSAIKKRSNLLKNVSFTQAGLHIWAATALLLSIMKHLQPGRRARGMLPSFLPPLFRALSQTFPMLLHRELWGSWWQRFKPRRGLRPFCFGWLLRMWIREKSMVMPSVVTTNTQQRPAITKPRQVWAVDGRRLGLPKIWGPALTSSKFMRH